MFTPTSRRPSSISFTRRASSVASSAVTVDLPTAPVQLVTATTRRILSDSCPDEVARLKAAMQTHHAGMPAPLWPSFIEVPVHIDKTLDQPVQPGDEYTYWYN